MEHNEEALVKLEEAKRHIAHLEQKTALYQAIMQNRSPDTTNPGTWGQIMHMHGDVFYASVRKQETVNKAAP